MSEEELDCEYRVIYETRLGILTDGRRPSNREERELARQEADAAVKAMREPELL